MPKLVKISALMVLVAVAASCNALQSLVHDDVVAARVGKHKLYLSEIERHLPDGISASDSMNLSLQYINSWAADQILCDMAERQLSKEDCDVSAELENYRATLLRFRYEQRFVNERLDTAISESQLLEYYNEHQSLFALERPILKVRFLDIYKSTPEREEMLKLMASNKPADVVKAEEMAAQSAIRYFDHSQEWMDAAVLAREFSTDYSTMLSQMNNSFIRMESPDAADIKVAYVREIKRSGIAPFEYSIPAIQDYILSARKRALLQNLEQSLLESASDNRQFVIY